ncbi:MAG: hypothetical protein A2X25_15050 [Chloroflexi bacterium GWB2_49_20]|nr:MAG: hypothetical protein A2X25_15050 [Chloroflexi bacterium GWB2_49_20]OGN80450.1 MAG: hypothetical protein A2X26_12795 [Chloroflexi bacterium GWC2_49_37]OGN84274.1 MAG: hypothetical protein A2X27_12595 [Chloroflexi bacterium GWD2_49_16]
MLAPVVHILPLTTIRRERLLPVSGRVVARLDQKVSPVDVVADANLGQHHILVDVARLLGITPDKADGLIQCKIGERLTTNQLIAQIPGLISHPVQSPNDGRVVAVGGGQVLMEIGDIIFELRASIPGIVTRLIPDRGVEITANGTLIQGVWGNDRVDLGLLLPAPQLNSPGDVLEASQLDISLRGAILLAGHCSDPNTLQAADELPLRGLILGSISPDLLPLATQARFPIVVTDGFGNHPMNPMAYKLLITNTKREVALNSAPYNHYSGTRPEIIIPLPLSQPLPQARDTDVFSSGQQVRICRNPNIFEVGTLTNLLSGLTVFPSGLSLPAADVLLESGQKVVVPLVNLEVLG